MTKQKDRYKLDLFYPEPNYLNVQDITDDIFSATDLCIIALAMDFPDGTTAKDRKTLENKWLDLLPKLDKVKSLSIRLKVSQDFFNAVCKMKNLERLHFWTSTVEDISEIAKLKNLNRLDLESFSRLTDIGPLLKLSKLKLLYIENSYKIENYDIIGKMTQLIGLKLNGSITAPKNLRLPSLKPFANLRRLEHLDLDACSVIDNSYDTVLALENLKRFDILVTIPKDLRDKIKSGHKNLQAGMFMDWDYDKKKIYEDKQW
jgi:Leucine-rich repeat (LRR) protein